MTRNLALFLALCLTGAAHAGDEVIAVPEVDVRSGPSTVYYITGKLRQGEKVNVQGQPENGFLKIAPPEGSFSLIRKEHVLAQSPLTGAVITDNAETRMGGQSTTYDRRGAYLPKGAGVQILGEASLPSPQGPVAYYKIVPLNEHRYIPATAIQRQPEIIQTSGPGPGLAGPDRSTPSMSPETAAKMQVAEQAYRKAEATGSTSDWNEAHRLWKEMEQCPSHEARMAAWNRLEWINRKRNGLVPASPVSRTGFRDNLTPGAPARFGSSPASLPMRPRSAYTYAQDGAQLRLAPIPQSPAPPAAAARPPAGQASQARYIPPPAAQASGSTLLPGRLVRSSKTDINGKPLYLLVDSQSQVKCYLTPAAGQNLDRFVEQNVQVQGDGFIYRADLRQNLLVVSDVRGLN